MNEQLPKEPSYFSALVEVLPVGDGRHLGREHPRQEFCRVCGAVAHHGIAEPGFNMHASRRWYCGQHVGMVESSITDSIAKVMEASE